jgi:hypothetical protein
VLNLCTGAKFHAGFRKGRLAAEVADHRMDFEMALSDKRKYPVRQFREFWGIGRHYAGLTKRDPMIHRSVVSAVNGLTDFVIAERKRVPGPGTFR